MRPDDYGPVPISRIKAESTRIFEALAGRRRVLISKRGQVVAVIDPPGRDRLIELAAYALPRAGPLVELTAGEINQGSPSRAIQEALEGRVTYVTRDDHVFGFLRRVDPAELAGEGPSLSELEAVDDEVLTFVEAHPDANAADVARHQAKLLAELEDRARSGSARDAGASPEERVEPVEAVEALLFHTLEKLSEARRITAVTAGDEPLKFSTAARSKVEDALQQVVAEVSEDLSKSRHPVVAEPPRAEA